MKTMMVLLAAALVGGCGYIEPQMHLTEQARRGLELVRQGGKERTRVLEQYQQSQRQRLEEAFDADVRERANLSGDWVIEHRKAYTAAMEAMWRQQAASGEAAAATERNIGAIDAALARLLTLQAAQLRLLDVQDLFNKSPAISPAK